MSAAPVSSFDPSATIGQAFSIYRENVGLLLPPALALYAISGLATVVLANGNFVSAVALNIVAIALSMIYTGGVVQVVRDAQDGHVDSSVGQIISAVLPVLVPLILVAIVAAVLIVVGLALFIVPGIYLFVQFAVVGPVTVIERPGVFAALGRSRELVKGNGWPVFGLILLIIVLTIVASIITAIIGAPLGDGGRAIVQWLSSSLFAPIGALATGVAYLRLREGRGEPPLPTGAATPPAA